MGLPQSTAHGLAVAAWNTDCIRQLQEICCKYKVPASAAAAAAAAAAVVKPVMLVQ
jgi:hypothetical protein